MTAIIPTPYNNEVTITNVRIVFNDLTGVEHDTVVDSRILDDLSEQWCELVGKTIIDRQ